MPIHFRLIACLIFLYSTAFCQTEGSENTGPDRTLQCAAFGGGVMADGSTLYWSLGEPATAMLQGDAGTLAQGFWQVAALPAGTKKTVQEDKQCQVTCFPNPLGPELTVQWTDATKPLRANLFDLSGRLLETALVQGGNHRFDFSARPSGVYLLHIEGEKGEHLQTFKLLKQQ